MKKQFILSIILFLIFIYFFIRNYIIYHNLLKYQKRFYTYSYNFKKDKTITYKNQILKSFLSIIKSTSKFLIIFPWNRLISKIYKRCETRNLKAVDFLSIKFIIALTFVILLLILYFYKCIKLSLYLIIISFVIGFLIPDIFLIIKRYK